MILLTGANGFLGREFLARHSKKDVIRVVRPAKGPSLNGNLCEMDLADPGHYQVLFPSGSSISTVVHLASHIDISLRPNPGGRDLPPVAGPQDSWRIYRDGLLSTVNLMEFCLRAGIRNLLFASSQTVYGMPEEEVLTENSPLRPLEHYAAAKVCAENALHLASARGLKVVILRMPGLYGESRRSGTVFRLCSSAMERKTIEIDCAYPLPLDVLHVEDAVTALEKALSLQPEGCETFNISTGEPCSLSLLAETICSLTKARIANQGGIPQPVIRMNAEKAEKVLGWRAVGRRERLQRFLENV